MKILKTTLKFSLLAISMLLFQLSNAQKIAQKSANIKVDGTSPMHDWTMTANNVTFSGTISDNTITNVKFAMVANNLKSTKGKMMDNKAYNALKTDKNPNIYFASNTINIGKSNVSGKLTIAGVSKNVSFPVSVTKKGNSYIIDGKETLKLSDFGMERPGFMGIKTGDEVTITVNIVAE